MLWMPKRAATSGTSSVFNLATTSEPLRFRAILANSGAATRHGPHQGAQKSTSTGQGDLPTRSAKSFGSVTGYGSLGRGRAILQFPQRAFWPSRAAGMRFCEPQEAQRTITALT